MKLDIYLNSHQLAQSFSKRSRLFFFAGFDLNYGPHCSTLPPWLLVVLLSVVHIHMIPGFMAEIDTQGLARRRPYAYLAFGRNWALSCVLLFPLEHHGCIFFQKWVVSNGANYPFLSIMCSARWCIVAILVAWKKEGKTVLPAFSISSYLSGRNCRLLFACRHWWCVCCDTISFLEIWKID